MLPILEKGLASNWDSAIKLVSRQQDYWLNSRRLYGTMYSKMGRGDYEEKNINHYIVHCMFADCL